MVGLVMFYSILQKVDVVFVCTAAKIQMNHCFTLYAPYVAIPHMSIISREIAEAMHMSEAERQMY